VLERVSEALCPDIPANMFVTCLYAVLDPASGRLRYANAGHDLPYRRHGGEAVELRATGLPLGLLSGMAYEEQETVLEPGDSLLLYSDGLVEAHDRNGEMFGFPRVRALVRECAGGDTSALIDVLLAELGRFTGAGWDQEDDITLVAIQCSAAHRAARRPAGSEAAMNENWQVLADFTVPSAPGNERLAVRRVDQAVAALKLTARQRERLGTAVAEATMNAMEHGNRYQADLPVAIRVLGADAAVAVRITDQGEPPIPDQPATPDLEAKLAGTQSPRGWGLFLIKNMVDEMDVIDDVMGHTVELVLHRTGEDHGV
jgi:anti-sigma regulatory factor (Ser/Thr protein kinase)